MDWQAQYSSNVTLKKPLLLGELLFKFPDKDGVHYIVKQITYPLIPRSVVSMDYIIKPSGATFKSAGGGIPKLRLFFQRLGDDGSGFGDYGWYRWWSNPTFALLQSGSVNLSAQLKPDQWQAVNGKMGTVNPAAFQDSLSDPAYIGFTFGDDNGAFGHGAWTKVAGFKFRLNKFQVT